MSSFAMVTVVDTDGKELEEFTARKGAIIKHILERAGLQLYFNHDFITYRVNSIECELGDTLDYDDTIKLECIDSHKLLPIKKRIGHLTAKQAQERTAMAVGKILLQIDEKIDEASADGDESLFFKLSPNISWKTCRTIRQHYEKQKFEVRFAGSLGLDQGMRPIRSGIRITWKEK